MGEVWFISDTHFGHSNILKFERSPGVPLRDFSSVWEMEGYIYDLWNETVKPQDKVYHLGDVAFTKPALERMISLPGKKRLVRGNHDKFKTSVYMKIFEEIYGVKQIDGFWFTHVPMHEDSVSRAKINIHGHLHANSLNDWRYFNASVEAIDYRPVNFDEIKALYEKNKT